MALTARLYDTAGQLVATWALGDVAPGVLLKADPVPVAVVPDAGPVGPLTVPTRTFRLQTLNAHTAIYREEGLTYSAWCRAHGCTHAHCPHACEHPQPFVVDGDVLICGRCAILDGRRVEMIPCTPEVCA